MANNRYRKFLCSWDNLGFECIEDMTSWEKNCLLEQIAGKELSSSPVNLNALVMRAQFNTQRNPEIWVFTTDYSVTKEDIVEISKENPQELVDMIRKNGTKVFGHTKTKQVIV